jgi:uncharacterized membrane-anchored protein
MWTAVSVMCLMYDVCGLLGAEHLTINGATIPADFEVVAGVTVQAHVSVMWTAVSVMCAVWRDVRHIAVM